MGRLGSCQGHEAREGQAGIREGANIRIPHIFTVVRCLSFLEEEPPWSPKFLQTS